MTRLIDLDELLKELEDWKSDLYDTSSDRQLGVTDAIVIACQMPTVDAEPVRHGKWIDETFKPWGLVHHPFKCNLCGECAEYASPYCPNCGARMDEE